MRVLVAGLGRFGGGAGALSYFAERGDEIIVTERAPARAFADVVEAWASRANVGFHFETESIELLEGVDLLVPSPALPDAHPLIREARRRAIRIAGEIELFLERCRAPVLAITGSNGKTTTAHLLAAMIEASGRPARLAGNMGISLLPEVHSLTETETVVLEISSFQLDRLDLDHLRGRARLRGGILTSFAPNHLDRHPDLAAYAAAKARLFALLPDGAPLVIEGESETEGEWIASGRLDRLRLLRSDDLPELKRDIRAVSPNGVVARNAIQAARLGEALGLVDRGPALEAARAFRPLPDRLELVAEDGRRRFVNDSKSTTPEATAAGVEAFEGEIHLIAGGHDKQLDPAPLLAAARACRSVRLLGATAPALARALHAHPDCRVFDDLEGLLDDVFARVASGVVLLSPGHASYGLWRDYRARGEDFRAGVGRRLAAEKEPGRGDSRLDSVGESD